MSHEHEAQLFARSYRSICRSVRFERPDRSIVRISYSLDFVGVGAEMRNVGVSVDEIGGKLVCEADDGVPVPRSLKCHLQNSVADAPQEIVVAPVQRRRERVHLTGNALTEPRASIVVLVLAFAKEGEL